MLKLLDLHEFKLTSSFENDYKMTASYTTMLHSATQYYTETVYIKLSQYKFRKR